MSRFESAESIDTQLTNLRSSISDLAHQIDLYKTKTGAALGGGVFLLLLAAGAYYDLIAGKAAAWSMIGLTHQTLLSIATGLVVGAIVIWEFLQQKTELTTDAEQRRQLLARQAASRRLLDHRHKLL